MRWLKQDKPTIPGKKWNVSLWINVQAFSGQVSVKARYTWRHIQQKYAHVVTYYEKKQKKPEYELTRVAKLGME